MNRKQFEMFAMCRPVPLDIDDLAIKHVNSHPNDKSGRYLAKMNRAFGREKTDAAIKRAEEVRAMLDPTYEKPLTKEEKLAKFAKMYNGSKSQSMSFSQVMKERQAYRSKSLSDRIRGRIPTLSIIDEIY